MTRDTKDTAEKTMAEKNTANTPADINPTDERRVAYCLYATLALGMLAQFNLYTLAPATVALVLALVYAYIKRKELRGTVFENHYQWMTRTFWIGGAVYMPVATIILAIYQLMKMDMTNMFRAMSDGEQDVTKLIRIMAEDNSGMIFQSAFVLTIVFAVWWWLRCARGLYYLRRGSPLPRVTHWL